MKKVKDLLAIAFIYVIAYAAGIAATLPFEGDVLRFAVFDAAATVVTFIFSVALHNSSVYDAYWSLTPMVMSVWLFISYRAFSVWQILFLIAFNIWSARLTVNWVTVFTDFSYEDWRYKKFRDENGPFMWFIINFFGIHLVPTVVVFLGMLPLFEMANNVMSPLSLIGDAVILFGVVLEFSADRDMHKHLASAEKGTVCRVGLWKYSRHPNYLGEISVWLGTFLAMLPSSPDKWYCVIGFVSVTVLFNAVSVPLAEKRQLARRKGYADYKKTTSRLLLLPEKKELLCENK